CSRDQKLCLNTLTRGTAMGVGVCKAAQNYKECLDLSSCPEKIKANLTKQTRRICEYLTSLTDTSGSEDRSVVMPISDTREYEFNSDLTGSILYQVLTSGGRLSPGRTGSVPSHVGSSSQNRFGVPKRYKIKLDANGFIKVSLTGYLAGSSAASLSTIPWLAKNLKWKTEQISVQLTRFTSPKLINTLLSCCKIDRVSGTSRVYKDVLRLDKWKNLWVPWNREI
ncbi:hypothetical protein RRG08_064816, partial [Elysia crispata]